MNQIIINEKTKSLRVEPEGSGLAQEWVKCQNLVKKVDDEKPPLINLKPEISRLPLQTVYRLKDGCFETGDFVPERANEVWGCVVGQGYDATYWNAVCYKARQRWDAYYALGLDKGLRLPTFNEWHNFWLYRAKVLQMLDVYRAFGVETCALAASNDWMFDKSDALVFINLYPATILMDRYTEDYGSMVRFVATKNGSL